MTHETNECRRNWLEFRFLMKMREGHVVQLRRCRCSHLSHHQCAVFRDVSVRLVVGILRTHQRSERLAPTLTSWWPDRNMEREAGPGSVQHKGSLLWFYIPITLLSLDHYHSHVNRSPAVSRCSHTQLTWILWLDIQLTQNSQWPSRLCVICAHFPTK